MKENPYKLEFAQLGIIVKDLEKAIEKYEKIFQIGPFNCYKFSPDKFWFGEEESTLEIKIAKYIWQGLELELIEASPTNPGTLEFIEAHGDGLQHMGYYVEDFDGFTEFFVGQGYKILHRAEWLDDDGDPTRAAYFDTQVEFGYLMEVMERRIK